MELPIDATSTKTFTLTVTEYPSHPCSRQTRHPITLPCSQLIDYNARAQLFDVSLVMGLGHYSCKECGIGCYTIPGIVAHMENQHSITWIKEANVLRHVYTSQASAQSDSRLFLCNIFPDCSRSFATVEELVAHKERDHLAKCSLQCRYTSVAQCGYGTNNKFHMKFHIKNKHLNERLLDNHNSLVSHEDNLHYELVKLNLTGPKKRSQPPNPTANTSYQIAPQLTLRLDAVAVRASVRRYIYEHGNENISSMDLMLAYNQNVKKLFRKILNDENIWCYKCSVCGIFYQREYYLKKHLFKDHAIDFNYYPTVRAELSELELKLERKFGCSLYGACEEKFATRDELLQHKIKYRENLAYCCNLASVEECGYATNQSEDLLEHIIKVHVQKNVEENPHPESLNQILNLTDEAPQSTLEQSGENVLSSFGSSTEPLNREP